MTKELEFTVDEDLPEIKKELISLDFKATHKVSILTIVVSHKYGERSECDFTLKILDGKLTIMMSHFLSGRRNNGEPYGSNQGWTSFYYALKDNKMIMDILLNSKTKYLDCDSVADKETEQLILNTPLLGIIV